MRIIKNVAQKIWSIARAAARTVVGWVRALPWRKMYVALSTAVFILVFLGGAYYLADSSYKRGYDSGERAGQCQIGCAMMDAEYSHHDDDGACWCGDTTGMYYFMIPLRNDL